jgi:hypothetical protein
MVMTHALLSVLASTVSFPESAFIPIAVGFFGLATGYLIYGPEELFKLPTRSRPVDLTTGIWGIWMPGFLQFLTGVYLFAGLAWFHSFREPTLYMTALAFTAYGVHWFAIGMARTFGGDPRPTGLMSVPFTFLSVLGIIVFFNAHDEPVGVLFIGLTLVACGFESATALLTGLAARPARRRTRRGDAGRRRGRARPRARTCRSACPARGGRCRSDGRRDSGGS